MGVLLTICNAQGSQTKRGGNSWTTSPFTILIGQKALEQLHFKMVSF